MHRALLVSLGVLVSACASESPKAPARDPNLVAITVYRPHSDLHATDYPFVYVEKDRQGALTDTSTVNFDLPAGLHRFALSNPARWQAEQSWTLNAAAGKHYYFRLGLGEAEGPAGSLPRYVSRLARVDEMPEAAALAEIDLGKPDLQAVFAYVRENRRWDKDSYRIERRPDDGPLQVYWVVYKDDEWAAPTAPMNSFELRLDPATHEVVGVPAALGRKRP